MHTYSRTALVLLLGIAACGDPVDPPYPAAATAASPLAQGVAAATAVPAPPAVRVTTAGGRPLQGVIVQFVVESGGGTLTGAAPVTDIDGIARVEEWMLGAAPGRNSVRATVTGITDHVVFEAMALPEHCSGLVTLDLSLGEFVRLKDAAGTMYPCLLFDARESAGSEYVLLFENLSSEGGFDTGLFPGPAGDTSLAYTLDIVPLTAAAGPVSHIRLALPSAERTSDVHTWDFGAGRIREHVPDQSRLAPAVQLMRDGRTMDLNSALADPVPGDTIQVLMEAIPRLGTSTEVQSAVIRYVSDHLIIAEDVRLTTDLVREGGGHNTLLSEADMAAIAAEYAAVARIQGDMFFEGRHNSAVEDAAPHRITAVHSLMPADNIWGYTYSISNYFVWDYWVATDGSTKGLNQHPQRVADNLFMHEIAHMRHMGMLQRRGLGVAGRGNRWLVEGFARFVERLPIAARLLGTTTPSRTGNVVLPRNPAFNNAYFLDDVPTYLDASSSMYFGYQNSSFVFDYFADRVAQRGGDWMTAVREFLLAGASVERLDDVVGRWLPGTSAADLLTQARIALYTDDIGTAGLPPWTQYHQYRLRESRPAPDRLADEDPRAQWMRLSPTIAAGMSGAVEAGGAVGFLIDGSDTGAGVIRMSGPPGPRARVSIARIR
ncbi:MAG TPA: hypothetical protein VHG09_05840 [Longimicrobiales bacterium]|nr:hypothetical protein [Longimicrobiales bacterium]